ncbi:MAG TPA: helix-turn-helix transcriptional regulator [Thermoleophilaceae bacterium]|nr:helix-turn-helix transcriptional regulator [Thermoleophilaceae bacterium]
MSPGTTIEAESPGTRVARARRTAGLTQRYLAAGLGVSLWTVDQLERGRRDPARHLPTIAQLTNRPENWLRGETELADRPESRLGGDAERTGRPESRGVGDVGAAAVAAPPLHEAGAEVAHNGLSGSERGRGLVLAALGLLVVIRFFTEVLGVLPRALNFIDVPLLVLLVVAAAALHPDPNERGESTRYLPAAVVFLLLCVIAAVANPSRVEIGPVLVFVYGFLGPLVLYWSVFRLWPPGSALRLSRLLVGLLLVQLAVVATIDLPRFISTDNPDEISGTFGENPYQLVFFLLVVAAVLAGIFTFEHRRAVARFAPALFLAILGVILLAQFRALLFTTALAILALTLVLGSARARGLVAGLVVAAAFVTTLSYTSQAFPVLNFAPVLNTFQSDPTSYVSEKGRALSHFARLYGDEPRYIATGTGPGTYSSRAWQTFANVNSTSESNVQRGYASFFTGGEAYQTDVSRKYVEPQFQKGRSIQGSKALTAPFSSYGALLAEIGLLGFLLIVGIYIRAFVQAIRMTRVARLRAPPGDPLPALLLGSAMALFVLLQLGFLENWLEVTRVTFPTWILLAVATKEFRARYATARI